MPKNNITWHANMNRVLCLHSLNPGITAARQLVVIGRWKSFFSRDKVSDGLDNTNRSDLDTYKQYSIVSTGWYILNKIYTN